jgi:protein involved in polysaccharide export with SLBB domain
LQRSKYWPARETEFQRPVFLISMRKQLSVLLTISWFLALRGGMAQTPTDSQSAPSDRSLYGQQTVDCTDPANAASSACMNSGASGTGYPSGTLAPGTQGGGQQRGDIVGGSNRGGTYNDNGGLNEDTIPRSGTNPNLAWRRALRPEPLTEFQRLVADSIGETLPIFGAELFRNVPSTFSPLDQVPVTPDYVIGPGDELRVRVWGQVSFNANVRVDRSGAIYLPHVGEIHVAGLPFSELDDHIRSGIARVFRNFELNVDLGQLRSIQVFVVGQARSPGAYTVSSLSTLVNAVFASGGPNLQGSMRHIQLKRGSVTVTDFDLYDLLLNGDKSKDVHLLPGDVIFIPTMGPQVALAGSVRKPAIYELSGPTEIGKLLGYAGGRPAVADGSRVSLERIAASRDREAMEISLDEAGLATVLQDGDFVRVLSIVPRFSKTVTLRGNLANPGRFAWHPGMHLSELIPDKESLLTRNYWWRRAQLGLPAPEFQPFSPTRLGTQVDSQLELPRARDFYPNGQPDYSGKPVPQPRTTPFEGTGTAARSPRDAAASAARVNDETGTSESPDQEATASTTGTSQQRTGRTDTADQEPQAGGSAIGGQEAQIVTQNVAGGTGKIDVRLSAPEIDWSYAVIERLDPETLKTSLIPFDLGKLIVQHDSSQDLEVHAGDVITIFSQADIRVPLEQQTKFVRLEGEFASSGVYSVQPGETLRHLVARAGAFSSHAYLYGSEFTRESARAAQQQRLNEYVRSVEVLVERSQLAADPNQQALLARLRQLRATGRIVLELKANSTGAESLPDLPLEDGDRFVVPPVPADIKVVGAVYDQNSFVYESARRTADYLRLAGGPSREADRLHMFIIRADGSVVSRTLTKGYWGNSFKATRLYPGDTVVVPEKIPGPSALKSVLDWSQVFAQLAVGAAAINVIK